MGNYHRSWECSNKIHVIGWQCQMDNFSFPPPTTLTLQANKIRIDFHAKNLINFLILDSICRVSQFHLQYPSSTSSFTHLCPSAGWSLWFSECANVWRVALLERIRPPFHPVQGYFLLTNQRNSRLVCWI